jgi:hypothetical protein
MSPESEDEEMSDKVEKRIIKKLTLDTVRSNLREMGSTYRRT